MARNLVYKCAKRGHEPHHNILPEMKEWGLGAYFYIAVCKHCLSLYLVDDTPVDKPSIITPDEVSMVKS
jgi:hypothetical protein